ncbi:flagellar hook-associated protein FlgK [Comamonas jiangduensis]|uniref:flagellar hook-associated protein FlgK n=1 Tax=Comamonas jiangduensis TaxID=1194168 RepID=UPI0028A98D5C|nr:flagellar hook-associated protein FlgK [Comamonas jiangduensis]
MSLMNVGVSALIANQQALTTTGHNIANVNSAAYSRQTIATKALVGQNMGTGYVGKGVQVATIMRNYNELLGKQSNAANAASAADAIRYQSLVQMQDVYSGGDSSLGAAINSMMNAFADVEAAPADGTARNVVLTRMSELTARFRAASATLQEMDYATNQQVTNNVTLVNNLAGQVASLNTQIARALASGHQPNDLLDARDQIIREINQYVQTTQVDADSGAINLFVGGSQALVLGSSTGQLSVAETAEYPGSGKLSLYFSQPNGERVELTANMVGGGEIAGLLKFNNDDLVTGRNLLGRLALSIGTELNQQNKLGLTLSGNFGTDLFKLTTATTGWSNIAGYDAGNAAQSAQAAVTDTHALVASDYRIQFNGAGGAQLVRLSDGKLTDLNVDPATGIDQTVDGLQFTVPGAVTNAAQKGQSILFQPFSKAADEIQPLVHNAADLAVSNAVTANITSSNAGTLQLSSLRTQDTAGLPATGNPVVLRFNTDGTILYANQTDIDAAATPPGFDWTTAAKVQDAAGNSIQYESGKPIQVNGWSITLTGTPGANGTDTVSVGNAKDLGDGYKLNAGNASAFLALRDAAIFDNGTSLSDGFSSAMAVIGTRTQSAKYAAELSETVANNLNADRTAVSGVNLDEEAARLLQYQQAYQASAKIISTAQSLFDSVLSAVGGR